MHRLSTTAVAGMLVLTITGCGSGSSDSSSEASSANVQTATATQSTESSPELHQVQSKPITVAQKPAQSQSQEPERDRRLSQKAQPDNISTAGLIQPTNADRRTQQVQKGRPDPFAELYDSEPKVATAPQPKPIKLPPAPPVIPVVKPANPLPPAPIAPPQPDLAKGTIVLGVVEVGNQLQAIVQVPNEATSRYVSEGQRLADGQVLVKRIEMYPGSEPVVVLEQFGTEVSRAVGQEPVQAAGTTPSTPGTPSRTSSAISVPSIPPTSGTTTDAQNGLPPSPPLNVAVPDRQSREISPSSPELGNQSKMVQPQMVQPPVDDSNAQSSRQPSPAVDSDRLSLAQPATAVPAPTKQDNAAQASSNALPSEQSSDSSTSGLQSSTISPAAQSKQRLAAIIARRRLISPLPGVQSNSKARMYRQELINRLLEHR